jgi:tetratricopeptide (TPR) repeat protein
MVEKFRLNFLRKTILVIFGIFLSLVFVEICLRTASGIFYLHLEHKNKIPIEEKDAYRILCLGESTTVLGLGGQSYPSQLQNILNQQGLGIKFRVINGGVIGINVTDIVRNLENNLDIYKPNLVITMIGVNDEDSYVFGQGRVLIPELISRFSYLKVYKLVRLLWAHAVAKIFSWEETIIDDRLYSPENKEFLIKKNSATHKDYKICLYLARVYRSEGNFPYAKQMYEQAIALNPKKRRIYAECAWLYEDRGFYLKAEEFLNKAIEAAPKDYQGYIDLAGFYLARKDFSKAEKLFQKAIGIAPKEAWIYIELGWFYNVQGQYSLAEKSFKKAEELCLNSANNFCIPYYNKGKHMQMLYGGLAALYSQNGQYKKAGFYYDKADELRTKYFNPITKYNYQRIKEILDGRSITLVCVQYPMRSVKPLKNIFERNGKVIFVDNERIFKDAVEKEGYGEYFTDIFAGDFGHCTLKGNRLLAENISKVIIAELFNR